MEQSSPNRQTEIHTMHKRYTQFYKIGGGLVLVLVGVWIGSLLFSDDYATNIYTEMLSIFVTILVLDRLNEWRNTQQLKKQLIREASSRDNSTALNAVDWLRAEKWLTIDDDSPLLMGAKLSRASLENAYLYEANLKNTNLYKCNLAHADLSKANMVDTFLHRAVLDYTSLFNTNFCHAALGNVSLRGAKYIETAHFDEHTILPDALPIKDDEGKNIQNEVGHYVYDKYWTPDTDMTRYTDPTHPDFWQPEWAIERQG